MASAQSTDPHEGQPVVTQGPPLAQSACAVILVHGRSASPKNILDLVPRLDRPECSYLAPAAANHTWYPLSFLAEREKNEPYLGSAVRQLGRVVTDVVKAGVPHARIVLLGFSQGACLVAEYAYQHPSRYGGVVMFSGGLIGPPGTRWHSDGSFGGTPAFFGCSDVDAHVPEFRVNESADVFARMGANVTTRIYPNMGHLISEDEILHARSVLDSACRGEPPGGGRGV
jgi:predicted esterase